MDPMHLYQHFFAAFSGKQKTDTNQSTVNLYNDQCPQAFRLGLN